MRVIASVFAIVLLAALSSAADKETPKPPPETSEVAYNSKTHGALEVRGDTSEWFLINRDGKKAGPNVPPKLNSAVELEPGTYEVSVNRTKRTVKIQTGKKMILQTGTLAVEGKGADWYAPFAGKERLTADAPPKLNAPMALFPGTYAVLVRVGDKNVKLTDNAQIAAGQKTVLKR
jgi:hypothetical protein